MTPRVAVGRYRHYKGGQYLVVGEALHTETEELLVLYRSAPDGVPGELVFARPAAMFLETVEIAGVRTPRFTPLDGQ